MIDRNVVKRANPKSSSQGKIYVFIWYLYLMMDVNLLWCSLHDICMLNDYAVQPKHIQCYVSILFQLNLGKKGGRVDIYSRDQQGTPG